jgi:hypothetical protein
MSSIVNIEEITHIVKIFLDRDNWKSSMFNDSIVNYTLFVACVRGKAELKPDEPRITSLISAG